MSRETSKKTWKKEGRMESNQCENRGLYMFWPCAQTTGLGLVWLLLNWSPYVLLDYGISVVNKQRMYKSEHTISFTSIYEIFERPARVLQSPAYTV
jgi:hypothetical protein